VNRFFFVGEPVFYFYRFSLNEMFVRENVFDAEVLLSGKVFEEFSRKVVFGYAFEFVYGGDCAEALAKWFGSSEAFAVCHKA